MFESEQRSDLKAALLLHNFTSIVCLQDYQEERSANEPEAAVEDGEEIEKAIYILAKKESNQLYKVSSDLQTIEKWLAIDHEITLLTIANGFLLI